MEVTVVYFEDTSPQFLKGTEEYDEKNTQKCRYESGRVWKTRDYQLALYSFVMSLT